MSTRRVTTNTKSEHYFEKLKLLHVVSYLNIIVYVKAREGQTLYDSLLHILTSF